MDVLCRKAKIPKFHLLRVLDCTWKDFLINADTIICSLYSQEELKMIKIIEKNQLFSYYQWYYKYQRRQTFSQRRLLWFPVKQQKKKKRFQTKNDDEERFKRKKKDIKTISFKYRKLARNHKTIYHVANHLISFNSANTFLDNTGKQREFTKTTPKISADPTTANSSARNS